MQHKKIQTGVVYATHGSGDYNRDNGRPIIVLDTTVWEQHNGHYATTYKRAPNHTPGKGNSWRRSRYGLPVVKLHIRGDFGAEDLETFSAVAKTVADQVAAHAEGPFPIELPDVGDHTVTFEILTPREVQAEWAPYVAERDARQQTREDSSKRRATAEEAVRAATAAARQRIADVLPDDAVLALTYDRFPEKPALTWVDLADLLDRYADARP